MRIDGEAELRIGCVCSDSERARVAFAEIEDRYEWADPDDCDVLVALVSSGALFVILRWAGVIGTAAAAKSDEISKQS